MEKYHSNTLRLSTMILKSYATNNNLPAEELPTLIEDVYHALDAASKHATSEPKKPAVSIKDSITADYLICLEDGMQFRTLKRHLRSKYGLTPEEYRQRWNLPADYPMVAPNYSKQRAEIARNIGLGNNT